MIHRTDSNYGEVCDNIADNLWYLCDTTPAIRSSIGQAARHTAAAASWSNFIVDYIKAYRIAIDKSIARMRPETATVQAVAECSAGK